MSLIKRKVFRNLQPGKFLLAFSIIVGLMTAIPYSAFAGPTTDLQNSPLFQTDWAAVGAGAGSIRFEHLGVQNGLSENTVLSILQDSQGFLWFGTREGLNKFDGYDFTVYQATPNDPTALSDAHITVIEETSDGLLWLGTYFGGLNRFNKSENSFAHYMPDPQDPSTLPDERVSALLEDSQENLWVGTRGGLSVLNPDGESFTHYQHDMNDDSSLSSNAVRSIFEQDNGSLWVGTDDGLNLYDPEEGDFSKFLTGFSSGVSTITSITGDGEAGLWLGTQGGLIHFDTLDFNYRVYRHDPGNPDSLSSNRISVVYYDHSGNLWVGFEDSGINLVTAVVEDALHVIQFAHQEDGASDLYHNEVSTIYEDLGGVVWIGTYGGGISKANPSTAAFGHYQHTVGDPNTPGDDNITALAFDSARRSLWIGTAGAGLDRMDLVTGEFVHYRHDPFDPTSLDNDHVTLLHIGPRGDLYVSTEAGVLETYNPAFNGFSPILPELVGYESETPTTAIAHDFEGMLWLSQASGELLKIDPAGDLVIRYSLGVRLPSYLQDNRIVEIYVDPQGILWLATENQGLIRFDPDLAAFSVLEKDGTIRGPSHNSITDIYASPAGVLWLGTEGGGLNRYDPKTEEFTYYTTQEGLPSNRVFGIRQDNFGSLWLSTGNGLARFSPMSGAVNTFDARDGLQSNTFNENAHAAADDGALFFGGVDGFNAFYPHMIEDNDLMPPVVITEVSLFNKVLAKDISGCSAELNLTHDQNFLSFEFAALDYSAPEDNQYAYIMEGLNEDYVNIGSRRFADFPNLDWGDYTFRLMGSNSDSVWNTTGACIAISIQPPFWNTWWFIGLVGVFLAGSVIAGYQWRVRSIEKQRQSLAVDVFERTLEIERRRQMASGLREVVRLLNSNQPLEKSLDFIVQQAVGLTSASKAAIFERQDDMVHAKACYPAGETYPVDLSDPESSSGRCLLESTFLNRLLIYSRIDPKTMKSDTRWELVSGDYRTILCTPLKIEDTVYGGLVLYYGEERTFEPDEINLAHTLADQASLAIANAHLKGRAESAAVTAERNRLARDLHDAVTQTLFSTSLIAEVLPKIWAKDPSQGEKRLDELRTLTRGALGEMRTLLMELRPAVLQEADPGELFKHLTDAFTGRTGVPVKFDMDIDGDCDVPGQVKHVFYRVAQEGLNNVFKHAEAGHVWFRFSCDSEDVALTVSDNGQGFDRDEVPAGHMGLEIMSERAESIGADLTLVSRKGEGTTLRLLWHFENNTIE